MQVKIDEQLSQLLKEPLIEAGYEVSTVLDQGFSGKLDEELWPLVQKEARFLITADKEFGNIRKYPPETGGYRDGTN
jgi:predicted nuclease of predicted toxin-antitoxin system